MPVHACTIIARNYLPLARVFGTSFDQHNPGGTLTVLVFDDVDHSVTGEGEPFDVIHIEDLGDDAPELGRMAAMYDVTEFATAIIRLIQDKDAAHRMGEAARSTAEGELSWPRSIDLLESFYERVS